MEPRVGDRVVLAGRAGTVSLIRLDETSQRPQWIVITYDGESGAPREGVWLEWASRSQLALLKR